MKHRKIGIWLLVVAFALVLFVFYLGSRPTTDEQRWARLNGLGRSERDFEDLHFGLLAKWCNSRFEWEEKALLGSGYLVDSVIPVANLRAHSRQVIGVLTSAPWPNAACRWWLDYDKGAVRLRCRKEDLAFWEKVLKNYQDQ